MEQIRCKDGRRTGSQGLDYGGPSRIAERGTSGTWDPRKHLGRPRPVDLGNYGVGIAYLNQLPTYHHHHHHIVITAQYNGTLDGHGDDEIIACTDETDRRCNEPLLCNNRSFRIRVFCTREVRKYTLTPFPLRFPLSCPVLWNIIQEIRTSR